MLRSGVDGASTGARKGNTAPLLRVWVIGIVVRSGLEDTGLGCNDLACFDIRTNPDPQLPPCIRGTSRARWAPLFAYRTLLRRHRRPLPRELEHERAERRSLQRFAQQGIAAGTDGALHLGGMVGGDDDHGWLAVGLAPGLPL